jgi:hypothetical protein
LFGKGIQICLNEEENPLPRGDKRKYVYMYMNKIAGQEGYP